MIERVKAIAINFESKINEINCSHYLSSLYFHVLNFKLTIENAQFLLDNFEEFADEICFDKKIVCISNIGAAYNAKADYDKAIKYLLDAVKIINSNPSLECRVKGIVYNDLAGTYSAIGDRDKAEYYYILAQKLHEENESDTDKKSLIPILVNLGDLYNFMGKFKKVEKVLTRAYELAVKNNIITFQAHIQFVRGATAIRTNSYKNAEGFLLEALDLAKKVSNKLVIQECICYLSTLYFNIKEYEKSIEYAIKGLNSQKELKYESVEYKKKCFLNLFKSYKNNGNEKKSLHYLEKVYDLNNNLLINKINRLTEKNQETLDKMRVEMETLQKEEENKRLKKEIDLKNRELTSKVLFSASNRSFIEDLKTKIQKQCADDSVLKLCDEKIAETQEWSEFEHRFNDVHPKYIEKLEDLCPNLSSMEIRVCILIKMGFDTNEVAGLLWISKRGVDQHRYRIKKKLNISENITTYLLKL